MTEAEIAEIAAWIAEAGLAGRAETEIVAGFCDRAVAVGLPLARAAVFIDTLHPIYEGRLFRWDRGKAEATLAEYGRSADAEYAERWRSSPFFLLLASGESLLRRRIAADNRIRVRDFCRIARGRDHGICGDRQPHRGRWRDRRNGLRLLFVDDRSRRRLRRRRDRDAAAPHALPRAGGEVSLARAHRRRLWSRPISVATPVGGFSGAASRAASRNGSRPSCGSAIFATTRAFPTRRRRSRSSRC